VYYLTNIIFLHQFLILNNNIYNMTFNKNQSLCQYIRNKYNRCKIKCGYYYDNLKPYIRLSLEFTKIIIGCLLFIFVPQICKGPDDVVQSLIKSYDINITLDQIRRPCTLQDNFFDVDDYKIFVITWNFLTLICFLVNFCWEIKREKYLQSHFESTIKKPITNINDVFEKNNKLDISYQNKTKILYYINYCCLFMVLTNILFTSIMIYKNYYDGFRSVTGLITCVILIFQKLYYNYDTLNISLKEGYVLSTTLTKPHDYNTLEPIKFRQNEYIKKYNKNKSYRIYYLGKETEDDIEYDKYAMQTYNEIEPTPILIPYDKNKNHINKFNKLVRKKIKDRIKNEIRINNTDNNTDNNEYDNMKKSLDLRELNIKNKKRKTDMSKDNNDNNHINNDYQENKNNQNNKNNQIVLYDNQNDQNNQIVLYDNQNNKNNQIVLYDNQNDQNNQHNLNNTPIQPISPRKRKTISYLSIENDMDIEEINDIMNMKSHINDEIKLKNKKISDHIKEKFKEKFNERAELMNQIKNNNIDLNKISESIV